MRHCETFSSIFLEYIVKRQLVGEYTLFIALFIVKREQLYLREIFSPGLLSRFIEDRINCI